MKRMSAVLLAALATGLAAAQTGTPLYSPGRSTADQKIQLRSWGSGIVTETEETAYEGATSIRFVSRNYFQGGTLIFGSPVSLASDYTVKSNLLRLIFKPLEGSTTSGGGGRPGGVRGGGGSPEDEGGSRGAGGAGGFGGGGVAGGTRGQGGPGGMGPGGMGPGGMGPGGLGTGGKGQGAGGGVASAVPALRTVRLVITTTDNLRSEAYIPVTTSSAAANGWRQVGVPLQAIRGFDRTNKIIREITFAGDSTSAFYLGDLRIVNDPTPIRGEITGPTTLNLALNDVVTLSASGTGGSSVLRYTWDFDDSDGITVDAEGRTISHRFRRAGTFNVTLTISDEYGLKTPYSTKIKVKVNP